MKYVFVGPKVPYVGKTLWEIVGNLKNFGVGRWVKTSTDENPEISFFKIIKVQPLPLPKKEFYNRQVMVWIEEIDKGIKREVRPILKVTDYAKFQLIPKLEEEKYVQAAKEIKPAVAYVKKYCSWPPLYKILWEKQNPHTPIPKLKTQVENCRDITVIVTDDEYKPSTSSLYKNELSVHEMYLEIVNLKKLIKAHKDAQKE